MDINNITRKISALRAMTAPDSITPEGLGVILQYLADLIGALSQIDTSEATDLIARVSAAEANAETARQAAQNALTASEANVIDSFSFDQTGTVLQLSLKQHGHNAMSVDLPGATTTLAGLLTGTDKLHYDMAYNTRLKILTTSSTDETVILNFRCENDTVKTLTFVGATSSTAGLMTAADKVKLDNLHSTLPVVQQTINTLANRSAFRELDGLINMLDMEQWPRQVIKSVTPGSSTTDGEIYFAAGMSVLDPMELQVKVNNVIYSLGQPNPYVVYLARDTKKFYIWDTGNLQFEEVGGSGTGNTSIEIDENYVTLQSNG